jgi:LacI family transcriptional regulator
LKEKDYIDTVLSTRVDGVLIAPAGDQSLTHLEALRKHNVPFVMLDRQVPEIECDMVLGDSKVGARKLVEYLIELGHRKIALINGPQDISIARARFEGYIEALRLHDLQIRTELIHETGYTQFDADPLIDKWLSLPDRPTAIFGANNFLALAAISSLKARGVSVPDDISVVCFDDLEMDYVVEPFLTVAAQPAYEFGNLGMQLLVERIQGIAGNEWRKIILPSRLCIRKSARSINISG